MNTSSSMASRIGRQVDIENVLVIPREGPCQLLTTTIQQHRCHNSQLFKLLRNLTAAVSKPLLVISNAVTSFLTGQGPTTRGACRIPKPDMVKGLRTLGVRTTESHVTRVCGHDGREILDI